MKPEEMILSTSNEAAQFVTNLSGWVSRSGKFWGNDERIARYDGCTHRFCVDCGTPVEKISGYMQCEKCREKSDRELFESYKKQGWDEETPICLYNGDEYFFCREDLDMYCEEYDVKPSSLCLVWCKPIYAREIDDDYYGDDLAQDCDLATVAPELYDRIEKLNEYIRDNKIILSWEPSNIAAIVE